MACALDVHGGPCLTRGAGVRELPHADVEEEPLIGASHSLGHELQDYASHGVRS